MITNTTIHQADFLIPASQETMHGQFQTVSELQAQSASCGGGSCQSGTCGGGTCGGAL